jgi:hypothetical protein
MFRKKGYIIGGNLIPIRIFVLIFDSSHHQPNGHGRGKGGLFKSHKLFL